jgi:hypothetical protein
MDSFSVHVALVGAAVLYCPETPGQLTSLFFFMPLWPSDPNLFHVFPSRGFAVTQKHQSRWDSSGRVNSPSQRTLPGNTQHSKETDIHAPGGIRTRNPSRRAAANPHIRPRGHWDWQFQSFMSVFKLKVVCTLNIIM